MKIQSTGTKTFEITHQHRRLATIKFPSVWKMKGEAYFGDHELLIESQSFWGQKYSSSLDGQHRADIKLSWKGCAEVSLYSTEDGEFTRTIRVKKESIWRSNYIITDEDGRKLLFLQAKWSWRKFNFSYEVKQMDLLDDHFILEALTYAVFIHKIQMNQAAAA